MILDKYMLVVEVTLFFDDCCVFSVDLPIIPVFSQLPVCLVSDVSLLLFFHSGLSYTILYHISYIRTNAVDRSQQLTVSFCVDIYVMPGCIDI